MRQDVDALRLEREKLVSHSSFRRIRLMPFQEPVIISICGMMSIPFFNKRDNGPTTSVLWNCLLAEAWLAWMMEATQALCGVEIGRRNGNPEKRRRISFSWRE
jgi:hypothetical protein